MTEQEKTLIAGCLEGEEAAWSVFVRQYSGLIYHRIKTTLTIHHLDPSQTSHRRHLPGHLLVVSKGRVRSTAALQGRRGEWEESEVGASCCGDVSISKFHFCLSPLLLGAIYSGGRWEVEVTDYFRIPAEFL